MTDPFDPHMQRVLVRTAMEDHETRTLVSRLISDGHWVFTDPASRWAWRKVDDGKAATVNQLKNEGNEVSRGDPIAIGLDLLAQDPDVRDQQYVRLQLVEFARDQLFRRAFDEARELWNRKKPSEARDWMESRMEEIRNLRVRDVDRGWHFEELPERMEGRQDGGTRLGRVCTGVDEFDRVLNGGMGRGHMGLFFAYSGVGKTHALVDQAWGVARERSKALFVTLEGGRQYIHDKFDARFMELKVHLVANGMVDPGRMDWVMRQYGIMRSCLVVRGKADKPKFGSADLKAEVDTLRIDYGWVPDAIVVDYADKLDTEGRDIRERHIRAVEELQALALYRPIKTHPGHVLWSATQAVRPDPGADNREHILWPSAIAEAWAKVWPVDVVISINRTLYEQADEKVRLALGKNRHGATGAVVKLETDYAGGAFIRPGGRQDLARRKSPPPPPPPGKP